MRAYHPLLTTEGYKSLRPEYAETKIDVGEVALLEIGDTLVGYEENVTVVSIEQRPEVENYYTYNLSVEGYHNYIVEGVVVHNAGCK
jgi:intein/homing endonuclease